MTEEGPDPYSRPVSPSWIGDAGGQRFNPRNRTLRDGFTIPRRDRILEIVCSRSLIAVVHPRGRPSSQWRLHMIDGDDSPLATPDGGKWPRQTRLRAALGGVMGVVGDEDAGPYALVVPFRCVCARMHMLDREKIVEAASRLQPSRPSAPARRIDFREVGRVARETDT